MIKEINCYIEESVNQLQNSKLITNNIKSIVIDNTYFDSKYIEKEDITNSTNDFIKLKDNKNPTLYWYELESSKNNIAIRKDFENYREETKRHNANYRNTSSFKKSICQESNVLYVGKVEKGFWGRLVTHLGYNKSVKTAGMQLFHWYDPNVHGNIKLNYIEFSPEMKHLIIILEKKLAKELKPLIGRY